jgi:hypothetical protein
LLERAVREPVWRWFGVEGAIVLWDGRVGDRVIVAEVVVAGVEGGGVRGVWYRGRQRVRPMLV